MRLILHVGMPKAGSTALQHGLLQLQDRLLEHGYLYPTGARPPHNQSFLLAAVLPPHRLPRYLKPHYAGRPAAVARDFEAWVGGIEKQIARHRPKTLLMSGQNLFKFTRPEQFEKLAALVRPLADEIEVVAYLRRPSDFYLASAQQILRADHRIKALAPVTYRAPLEGFAALADRLHVFKYDRALFPGGDLLRHFMQDFCPELPAESLPRLDANVSLSAEGLAVLAAYRREHHPDKAHQFVKDANLLLDALGRADRALPQNGRARLKPDLARTIDEGSPDLVWLRDTHGIAFDGIDYGRIAPMPPLERPARLDEICTLDPAREARVALHAFRYLAEDVARLGKSGAPRDEPAVKAEAKPAAKPGRPGRKRAAKAAAPAGTKPGRHRPGQGGFRARLGRLRSTLRPLLGGSRP